MKAEKKKLIETAEENRMKIDFKEMFSTVESSHLKTYEILFPNN